MAPQRVAIAHDFIVGRGGAERVALTMVKAFPGSPVYTLLYEQNRTFADFASVDVRPSVLNIAGLLRRHHRLAFPALPWAISSMSVREADILLCSSSGWAHAVPARCPRLVYCYTPARWLYQPDRYFAGSFRWARRITSVMAGPVMSWDKRHAQQATRYVTLSRAVRERIWSTYGIEAEILAPPHTIDVNGVFRPIHPKPAADFLLVVSRLLPYKNVSAIVDALARLSHLSLIVAGSGPELNPLRRLAPANVRFVGEVADEQLRWLYRNCIAVVAASHEDYGLTPLEAAAFGKPSVVLRDGGYLDTVIESQTGLFFNAPVAHEIVGAIGRLLADSWDADAIRQHAARFSEIRFIERLRALVDDTARGVV